jgi:crotonobetainyl-CoA:carnitine CoA-transferase CaiB-like acyl-CoA transferase
MESFTALAGQRVIELAGDPAVAYCAKLLGEFGAEIVKVEPLGSDRVRNFGPRDDGGDSALFIYTNTGKTSLCVEAGDAGKQALDCLLASADIVLGSESAAELAQRGLTHDGLVERGLIYISIRPYGLAGSSGGRAGTELDVFHAGGEGALLPGGLSYELFPDRPPVKAGRHLSEYDAGNIGAFLALALSIRRIETGQGGFADVSKQDVEVSLGRATIDRQLNQGIRVNRADRGYDYGGIFPCKEGFITVRPTQDAFWVALANGIGRPDLADDPRFASRLGRETNAADLDKIIRDWCSTRLAKEVHDQLAPHGTPIGYYADAPALLASEHAWTRGDLAMIEGIERELVVPRPGYTFGGRPLPAPTPWPARPRTDRSAKARFVRAAAAPATATPSDATTPLAGLRVLDLTWVAAGPYTTELLSMLGAEVAKVESSLQPDLFRQMADDPDAGLDRSSRFNAVNLNKRSVGINFKTAEGKAVLRSLAERADLIVSNYRPGVLERLGVTYDDLRTVNPNVVVVCISSAGRGGTDPGYAGYASIFNSIGGLGHLTGYEDGPAVEVRDSVDLRTGTVAAVGALAALLASRRGGGGTAVDVSAQQAITGLVGDSVVEYQLTGQIPIRQGNALYDLWPYGVYPCIGDDEWVAVATRDAQDRATLGAVLGIEFGTDRGAGDGQIAQWTAARTADQVVALLAASGVPCSKVLGGQDLLDDPHVRERGLVLEIDHPLLGKQVAIGAPWRIDDRVTAVRAAPALGEHTAGVLHDWLGLDSDTVARLAAAGAIEMRAES